MAAIASRPAAAIDLAQDVLGRHRTALDLDVLEHLIAVAELACDQVQDVVVVLALEDRFDDLLAPLQRAVGGGARSVHLETGAGRQDVGAVLALGEHRPRGRIRVAHDQKVELFDAFRRLRHPRNRVAAMPHNEHGLHGVRLADLILRQQGRIEPARAGHAWSFHESLAHEAGEHPLVVDLPYAAPVLPRILGKAVVERQRRHIEAEIGRALDVVVATKDVGACADVTDIAGGEQQYAARAHVGRADRVLSLAHRPDQGRGFLRGKNLGDAFDLRFRQTGDAFDLGRRPLLHLLADFVHAVDALSNEFLVFPAILENVPEDPVNGRNVYPRANPNIFGGVRRRPREAGIDDDHVGAVELLAFQNVLQRYRMCLGWIAAHDHDGLGIADIVVAVGHGAVSPRIGDARDSGRMADARLMIGVVGSPECGELAEEICGFVGEFRRAQPVHGFRS